MLIYSVGKNILFCFVFVVVVVLLYISKSELSRSPV